MSRILFSILFFITLLFSVAQTITLDSLTLALRYAKHDTIRCKILSAMIEAESDDVIWPKYNEQLLQLAENKLKTIKTNSNEYRFYRKHLAVALNSAGYVADLQGEIPRALECYHKSLKIHEEMSNKQGIAISLNNIGFIYYNQGESTLALEYYHKSLKIQEEIGDKKGIATSLNNIGLVYDVLGDPTVRSSLEDAIRKGLPMALDCYRKSLKIREDINDKQGIAESLENIGSIYYNHGDPMVKSSKEDAMKVGILRAMEYFLNSFKIQEEMGDKQGMASSLNNIGGVYFRQKNYSKAGEYFKRSIDLSEEQGFPENIRDAAKNLFETYKTIGKHQFALENYELYIKMRDSLNNIETQKAAIVQQTKYDYDKKKAIADKEHELQMKQQKEKAAADKTRQNIIIASVCTLLLLAAVFSGFLYNRFKVTRKQKQIIEGKSREVEEKNKDILDSIHYAKRIQMSLLPTDKYIERSVAKLQKKS